MKKLLSALLAITLLFTSTISVAFAVEGVDTKEIPSWVEEGEIWHPSDGIMPLEDFGNCPQNHIAPSYFVYQGYTEGNTEADLAVQRNLVRIVGQIPGLGTIARIIYASAVIERMLAQAEEGHLRTTYFKYVYTYKNLYWHHYSWFFRDSDGIMHYIGCEVKTNA